MIFTTSNRDTCLNSRAGMTDIANGIDLHSIERTHKHTQQEKSFGSAINSVLVCQENLCVDLRFDL